MMAVKELRGAIAQALSQFTAGDFTDNALKLFTTLGYCTDKRSPLDDTTAATFLEEFNRDCLLNPEKALVAEWDAIDMLFQLTKDEITGGNQLRVDFGNNNRVDNTIIESYLFFGIRLKGNHYNRTQLAVITREINKLFPMPVMLLFQHEQMITLSVINRRLNKRDESRDVLEKVTLIKDIVVTSPHRAHIEILFDLSLEQLYKVHKFSNFVELHQSWQKTLDSSELNKRFFRELSDWYFWATQKVIFPEGAGDDQEVRNATSMIRLITRLIFVWFLKEKKLVPEVLFNRSRVGELIHLEDAQSSSYYKAILQNLFFATLNQEMNTPQKPDNRKFRGKGKTGRDSHYMVHNVYRYEHLFKQRDEALKLFETVPFLNGGLFECLDQPDKDNPKKMVRVDGFSDRDDNPLSVPNYLFFSEEEQEIDLNDIYGTKNKRSKVTGLISIFNRYKFTIAENTPIEEEIALDPELLGKVFENLLAAYNPETQVTARKQTGSFYTPREVVDYMVNESLIVYFATQLLESGLVKESDRGELEERLRKLLNYNSEQHQFNAPEVMVLIAALDHIKILDPAVGSGAFPMGILQKLVFILGKLDPNNERWKHQQKEREIIPVLQDIQKAEQISYEAAREAAIQQLQERLKQIEADFVNNEMDYPRKLFLIENCIYGVDIQPIAVQIAKLRFFISLIVEQRVNNSLSNRGIVPLPNLETKFIAANTLIRIDRPRQPMLPHPQIEQKKEDLKKVRHEIFKARTPQTKQKYRDRDDELRTEIAELLKTEGWSDQTARQLAQWKPYDQKASVEFFDPEWMFDVWEGFDVVIGNPPYKGFQGFSQEKDYLTRAYISARGKFDYYVPFIEISLRLLKQGGVLSFICPTNFMKREYGSALRKMLRTTSKILQICDFQDFQIFESALNYTGIFLIQNLFPDINHRFLHRERSLKNQGFCINQSVLKDDAWIFRNDSDLKIIEKIKDIKSSPLGELTSGISEGIVTGKNPVFLLSSEQVHNLRIESEILKVCIRGRQINRYYISAVDELVIYPYRLSGNKTQALLEEIMEQYPFCWKYLNSMRGELSGRDYFDRSSKFWYELWCQRDMKLLSSPKILVPELSDKNRFCIANSDFFYGDTVCGITLKQGINESLEYLLGVLNSKLIEFYFKNTTVPKANGFYIYKTMFLKNIPIVRIDFSESKNIAKHNCIARLVSYILVFNQDDKSPKDGRLSQDKLMLQYFEQIINGLVYELYLPEDLHAHGFTFANHLKDENLPTLNENQNNKLEVIRTIFNRLYDQEHPIRQNLFALDTLPVIRMIEGKE
jgi:adenine-specific DNA-methyltransferase